MLTHSRAPSQSDRAVWLSTDWLFPSPLSFDVLNWLWRTDSPAFRLKLYFIYLVLENEGTDCWFGDIKWIISGGDSDARLKTNTAGVDDMIKICSRGGSHIRVCWCSNSHRHIKMKRNGSGLQCFHMTGLKAWLIFTTLTKLLPN